MTDRHPTAASLLVANGIRSSLSRVCKRGPFTVDEYNLSKRPDDSGVRTGYHFMHIVDVQPFLGQGFKVREDIPQMPQSLCADLNAALNSKETLDQLKKIISSRGHGRVGVQKYPGSGNGLVAKGCISKDEVVTFYTGTVHPTTQRPELLTERELKNKSLNSTIPSDRNCFADLYYSLGPQTGLKRRDFTERVCCIINGWNAPSMLEGLSLCVGDVSGNFANHSCRSNCELSPFDLELEVRGVKYIMELPCLRALRDIGKGEEITVDYGDCICEKGTAYDPRYCGFVAQAESALTITESDRIMRLVPKRARVPGRSINCGCGVCIGLGVFKPDIDSLLSLDENEVDQGPIRRMLGYPDDHAPDMSDASSNEGEGGRSQSFNGDSCSGDDPHGSQSFGGDSSDSDVPGDVPDGSRKSHHGSACLGSSHVGEGHSRQTTSESAPTSSIVALDPAELAAEAAPRSGACLMPRGYVPKQLSCRQILSNDSKQRAYDLAIARKYDQLQRDALAVCGLSKEDKLKHRDFVPSHAKTYKYALVMPPTKLTTTASRVPRSPDNPGRIMAALPVTPTDEMVPGHLNESPIRLAMSPMAHGVSAVASEEGDTLLRNLFT